mmetsp:Transcript_28558/g.87401  ORF Transcript_28558/g.87401 Transcript_28558/m.87401 type:complete len:262 (-) Transcript_28558:1702-2487(-)
MLRPPVSLSLDRPPSSFPLVTIAPCRLCPRSPRHLGERAPVPRVLGVRALSLFLCGKGEPTLRMQQQNPLRTSRGVPLLSLACEARAEAIGQASDRQWLSPFALGMPISCDLSPGRLEITQLIVVHSVSQRLDPPRCLPVLVLIGALALAVSCPASRWHILRSMQTFNGIAMDAIIYWRGRESVLCLEGKQNPRISQTNFTMLSLLWLGGEPPFRFPKERPSLFVFLPSRVLVSPFGLHPLRPIGILRSRSSSLSPVRVLG